MDPDPTSSRRSEPGLPGLIFQLTRELRTVLDRRMAAHGLTLQQASLLIRCVHHKGASPSELMPHLGTDKAGLSRLVDRLEAADLVARRAGGDRRSTALEATAAGTALAPKLEKILAGTRRRLLADLSAEEAALLESLLGRILASVRELERP